MRSSSECERGMGGEVEPALVVDFRRVVGLRGGLSGNEPDDDDLTGAGGGCEPLMAGSDENELDFRPWAPGHGHADETHTCGAGAFLAFLGVCRAAGVDDDDDDEEFEAARPGEGELAVKGPVEEEDRFRWWRSVNDLGTEEE